MSTCNGGNNQLLLQKVPNSRVAITQDGDWCSVLNEDDEIMPSLTEIPNRVLAAHHIQEEDGVVILEAKEKPQSSVYHRRTYASQTTKCRAASQNRLADSSRLGSSVSSALRSSELAWRQPFRTGTANVFTSSGASSNAAARLSPSAEFRTRTQTLRHPRSETSRHTPYLAKYQRVFANLAMFSLLFQAIQLSALSARQSSGRSRRL